MQPACVTDLTARRRHGTGTMLLCGACIPVDGRTLMFAADDHAVSSPAAVRMSQMLSARQNVQVLLSRPADSASRISASLL